jgi:aminobenzoyl-glutamate utilization protein B
MKAWPVLTMTALLLAAGPALAEGPGQGAMPAERLAELKARAVQGVEVRGKLAQEMNDSIFSFAELAFQEFETSKYVTDVLEKNGFAIERGVAGLPTGWVARWGSGGPVIALGSDIDCLPKAS